MRTVRSWLSRLAGLFNKQRRDRELADELESNLQLHIDENVRAGMSPEEARRHALIRLGGLDQTKESYRDRRGLPWLDSLVQDIRFGLRMLRKNPGFTAVAVLTLALGIGATTVIFSAVYAALLKPLPYPAADRLVFVMKQNPSRGWTRNNVAGSDILAWRSDSGAFEELAALSTSSCVVSGNGETEEDPCEVVSSSLFSMLGATPYRGRTFSVGEDRADSPRSVVLSYGFWQRRFGADESVVGRSIVINATSYTVIGIMSRNFPHLYAAHFETPEFWLSGISLSPDQVSNDYWGIGRLKPGVSLEQAGRQMDAVSLRLDQVHPDGKGWRAQMMTLRALDTGDTAPALYLLMGAVVFVLLIACANMANLLLARGASRAGEFAARSALGASRVRIVRQLLTENLVLSVAGGILGILLAYFGCKAMAAFAPPDLLTSAPGLVNGVADVRVLTFALATVLVTTVFFGLVPALQGSRKHFAQALNAAGRGQSPRSLHFGNSLVVSEIALAMVLLVGAGLMIRTLVGMSRVDLGLNTKNVLTLRVALSGDRYKQPQAQADFWQLVVAAIKTLPGVISASAARGMPIDGWAGQFLATSDQPNPPAGQLPSANYIVAGPDYFHTLQIPVLFGRAFSDQDTQTTERVAIVNEEFARLYFPGQNPLGKQIRFESAYAGPSAWFSVVGVAGDVLSRGPAGGVGPETYTPIQQYPWLLAPQRLLLRTEPGVAPESLVRAVTEQIHRIDASQPVVAVSTLDSTVREYAVLHRLVMSLLAAFAALAVGLSALGIYSVLSYSVVRRTREIGVRIALGAQRGDVLRLIVNGGAHLALLGIVIGIAAALALTRLMTDLLYGVRPTDLVTFVVVSFLLAATSLLACYIPARRAMRVDPMVALRHE